MKRLKIESISGGHRFILLQEKVSIFVKIVLLILTLVTILIPFAVLFNAEASEGMIAGAIVSAFCAVFLMRLFFWNAFGKEVFEIGEGKVLHYIDYRFFKDELLNVDDFSKGISFNYESDANQQIGQNDNDILDVHREGGSKGKFSFTISNSEEQLTKSNIKLTKEAIMEMINTLKDPT